MSIIGDKVSGKIEIQDDPFLQDDDESEVININESEVSKLAQNMMSEEQIAIHLGVPTSLIIERFSDVVRKGREIRKRWIIQEQFKLAAEGDADMLKWLGQQYLNQKNN
jgi:hypothetical protein